MALVVVLSVGTAVEADVVSDALVSLVVVLSGVPVVLDISEIVLVLMLVDSLDVVAKGVTVDAVSVFVLPKLLLVVSAAVEVTVGVVVDDSVLSVDKDEAMLLEIVASVGLELVLI